MKKVILGFAALMAMVALSTTTVTASDAKCGEGKCGTEKPAKCGEGKCGSEKPKPSPKCGEGKCGGK